jgi:septum formation protein
VKFKRLSINEMNRYLKSKEWEGKAGGYAIQGLGSEFIPWISGSYSGIVGLPLSQTISLLKSLGWKQ